MTKLNSDERLIGLIDMGVEISQIVDLDIQLDKVLSVSRQIVNAEAGSLYLKEGSRLTFHNTQNDVLQKNPDSDKAFLYTSCSVQVDNYSIAGYVAETGELLNIPDVYIIPDDAPYSFNSAYDELTDYQTRSMLTMPLKTAKGNIIGILQLINAKDNEDKIIAFSEDYEPLIMNFANIATAAIERNRLEKLINLIDLGVDISHIKDLDILLDRVLAVSRQIVDAEAGSIYIKENGKLTFLNAQNELLQEKLEPGRKLIYSTFSIPINNDSIAGYVANTGELLNIKDVYSLPDDVPYSFDDEYDKLTDYRTRSMQTIPLVSSHGNVVGVLQLINAKDENSNITDFSREDEPLLKNFANIATSAIERAKLTRAIILRVIKMAEMRDPKETGPHVNRVASYSVEIYEAWAKLKGLSQEEIEKNKDTLRMGAMLHDIGKVAISDSILKKPAKLTAEEFNIMKGHTVFGAQLFSEIYSDIDEAASVIALSHHERWDGNGYPGHVDPMSGKPLEGMEKEDGTARGKKGEEIHTFGRVVAIADVFDALSSPRVYKESWPESKVLDTLKADSGTQFDPDMVKALFSCLDVIRSISSKYPD